MRLTEEEWAAIGRAAAAAGVTRTRFAAEAALAAAGAEVPDRGRLTPVPMTLRALLSEVIAARGEAARIGNNLNQAVHALHANRELPAALPRAVGAAAAAVAALEEAAGSVRELVRRSP